MHICVVGGSGFIGTRLCNELIKQNIDFSILDLKESGSFPEKSQIVDIRNIDDLRGALKGDVVVNLAAVHRDDVSDSNEYYATNVEGTRNLCTVASEKGIDKIVFTSSVAVYGFAEEGTGEDGPIAPFNHYGKSKYQGEDVLREWKSGDPENRGLIIVRPTVVFGEGNRGNVYNLLNQISSGRFVMIGKGKNHKSMAYVGNVSAFLVAATLSPQKDKLINYIDKPDLDMNALVSLVRRELRGQDNVGLRLPYAVGMALGYVADAVAAMTGKNLPLSSIRVKKFCSSTSFSSAKAQFDDFSEPYSLEEGLRRTLDAEFLNPDPSREIFFSE